MEEKKEKTNHDLTIPILGMKCAACASRVEKGLEAIPGIHSVDVNLALSKATINYDSKKTNFQDIINEISKIGYEVPEEEISLLREYLPKYMGGVLTLDVPLLVEIGIGSNWDQAH